VVAICAPYTLKGCDTTNLILCATLRSNRGSSRVATVPVPRAQRRTEPNDRNWLGFFYEFAISQCTAAGTRIAYCQFDWKVEMAFRKSIAVGQQHAQEATESYSAGQTVWCVSGQLEVCCLTSETLLWRVSMLGYCAECGAKVNPQSVGPFAHLCRDCHEGLEQVLLLSASHHC
jgi:hypothetical protein